MYSHAPCGLSAIVSVRAFSPLLLLLIVCSVAASAVPELPVPLVLEDVRIEETYRSYSVAAPSRLEASAVPRRSANAADQAARLPGVANVANGPVTGQVQHRGLHGTRVATSVDGAEIIPACSNWMDAPLHYAPPALVESIEIDRGGLSVRTAADAPGGKLLAALRTGGYAEAPEWKFGGRLEGGGVPRHDRGDGAGLVFLARDWWRVHASGSLESSDDYGFPGGRVRPSGFERTAAGGGFSVRGRFGELTAAYRLIETRLAGTPALPMDMTFTDADIVTARWSGVVGTAAVRASYDYTLIEHEMDNFRLRTPAANRLRFARDNTRSRGGSIEADIGMARGTLAIGFEGRGEDQDKRIYNPQDSTFYTTAFNHIERDRWSGFATWSMPLALRRSGEPWTLEAGARYTAVRSNAGPGELSGGFPMMARNLRDSFNALPRAHDDENIDASIILTGAVSEALSFQVGGARKTRAPSYLERYAWMPMEASGGQADGNTYVGDVNLKSEVGHEVELGFAWTSPRIRIAPRGFYRRVTDYIQGVPYDASPGTLNTTVEQVSAMMGGDSTPLRFANVDAEFVGADLAWSFELTRRLAASGVVSWVRGRRKDIADNLYRIAPLSGHARIEWRGGDWTIGVEEEFAARQDRVSATNAETPTGGYGVTHLDARWRPLAGVTVVLGVQNVFEKYYAPHAAGRNRVAGDLPLGARLPGSGRSLDARMILEW